MNNILDSNRDLTSEILDLFIKHLSSEGILSLINIREIKVRYAFKNLLNEGVCRSKATRILAKNFNLPVRYIQEIISSN